MKRKPSCLWKDLLGMVSKIVFGYLLILIGRGKNSKSTSGCAMVLIGPNTYYPLNAFSKKQTVISTSSTEAEVVSANHAVRAEGIPTLALFEQLGLFRKEKNNARFIAEPKEDEVFAY